jgi:hypothetical protein
MYVVLEGLRYLSQRSQLWPLPDSYTRKCFCTFESRHNASHFHVSVRMITLSLLISDKTTLSMVSIMRANLAQNATAL